MMLDKGRKPEKIFGMRNSFEQVLQHIRIN